VNISLERAVDYLKDKELLLSQIKHKISNDVYDVCAVNLQVTEEKETSKEVGEEKRKKKLHEEKLRINVSMMRKFKSSSKGY
jgi:hypothetical protein